MKNKRALTLLLAASMLIPQFAVFTSAASDYNYIKIEEEVLVKNGTFDKEPTVKNTSKAYKSLAEGTWGLIPGTDGSAKAEYVTDGGNSFLRIETENNKPTVAYRIGMVEAGSYTLTFDIKCDAVSDPSMNRIYFRAFNLDENFSTATNGAAMNLGPNVTVNPTVTQKADWATLSFAIELTEAADLAFDFFPKAGGNDATITGTIDIDNVSLGRPTDVALEEADLTNVDSKAYTGANDATLEAGKWVATDNTYLNLDNSNEGKIVAAKKDSDIPNISQVWYNFPEALNAGKYRLTFDVITEETVKGNYGVADVTKGWGEKYTLSEDSAAEITGGLRYSMTFEVPADGTNVGFRYFQTEDKTRPSKPFSIENVKLESYTAGAFDPNAISWVAVETKDFTTSSGLDLKSYTSYTSRHTTNVWALKTDSGAKPTVENGRLVFNNSGNPDYILHKYNGNLTAGEYKLEFDLEYARNTSATEDYTVKTWTQVYIDAVGDLNNNYGVEHTNGFVKSPADGHLTGAVGKVEIPFTLTSNATKIYFRTKPEASNLPSVYYVDNYKLERKVVGAVVGGSWSTIYDSTTAEAPTVKTDAGVSDSGRKNHKDAWLVRENNNAIATTNLAYSNGKLEVTANETAIFGKPTVMYRFNSTLAKGTYSVDTIIKNLANVGFGETYTLSLHFSNGQEPVTLAQAVAKNAEIPVTLSFDLESDSNVVLCIQSTTGYTFTSAFEIKEVVLNKRSNPRVQLRSNTDIITFESDEGVYYMAVNAQSDIIVNYLANDEFRPGYYELSGDFKTAAENDVQLSTYLANMPLDVKTIKAGEEADDGWQSVKYSITLKRDTAISTSRGIRFEVNSKEPLYFKNLKLVFVEDLPKPDVNPAIAMILLKKIEGTYPGHIITKPIEYAINGGFDTEVKIDHDQSRGYLKHADGRWTYSKNSGDVKTSIVNGGTNSYAYFEVANSNPNVGYRVGTLPAGSYTLSFDIYPEYNIGSIRTRIYRLADGFAVGKTDYVIADNTSAIKVGQNNTLTYSFVLNEETTVAFGFYATKENPCPEKGNFRLDNVSVLKRP